MFKRPQDNKSLLLFFAFLALNLFLASSVFSQSGETLTITTYYPSPYGSYNELEVRSRLRVKGEADGDGKITHSDVYHCGQIAAGSTVNDIWGLQVPSWICDINNDDIVNITDVILLQRMVTAAGKTSNIEIFFNSDVGFLDGAALLVPTGNVGIGTMSPQARLDVAGGVRLGTDSTCNANKAGTMRYNAGAIEYCNGTSWQGVGGRSIYTVARDNNVAVGALGIWHNVEGMSLQVPVNTGDRLVFSFSAYARSGIGSSRIYFRVMDQTANMVVAGPIKGMQPAGGRMPVSFTLATDNPQVGTRTYVIQVRSEGTGDWQLCERELDNIANVRQFTIIKN